MIPQLLLFALCAVPSQGYALRQGVTPVQKVIALLQDMMAKGKQEETTANRVLGVAACINRHAKRYAYDENKVEHVEHVYQRILDDCNA